MRSKMKPTVEEILLSEIKFDETIYPRKEGHIPSKVQQYARDIAQIEQRRHFISVSIDNKLLDGKHRYLAYRKIYEDAPETKIHAFVYPVTEEKEQFALAFELNSAKGIPLGDDDIIQGAKQMYSYGYSQKIIAQKLSVSPGTISKWLSRTIKEEKEKQKQKVCDLWLACHTQEEIAKDVGIDQSTVFEWTNSFMENFLGKESIKVAAEHLTNFEPPIYNIWTQQKKSKGVNHFGNSEVRWLDNLLYFYTAPFDIVIDPFAGSGTTIDLCKKRFRRYWVGDRKPIVERETEIRKHDITDGLPDLKGRWKDVRLIYLDPPYWKQSEGKYSNDPTDLSNMSLEEFTTTLEKTINGFGKKLKEGHIALIIPPTQWNAPEKQYTDHIADMLRVINLPLDMRYSVPYESQQCNAQMVEWAKAEKKTLVLTREIVVWKKGERCEVCL